MNFLELIESKRNGNSLPEKKIAEFVRQFVAGEIPDYQMAAMLMAIFFRGLTATETRALTFSMRDSGEVLKFQDDPRPLVDKHSTGGVGDKISLPLAPLLACLGFRVPMISGRGLGITGGTLDKLESIPGFRTALSANEIVDQVQRVGCVICGQTDTMVPADKKLYALRDATGTVPSIPLITASILSKKLAENLNALLLDVKFGCAAFMQTPDSARQLAKAMVELGNECGVKTRAILTDMNTPLGCAAGNWLEVKESVECLENKGPEDLHNLVVESAAHLLVLTGLATDLTSARHRATACLLSGDPRRKFDEMLAAQGAELTAFNRQLATDTIAAHVVEVVAERSGFVAQCDARQIGKVVRDLGGGRFQKESEINFSVGIDRIRKPGERVQAGETLVRIHSADATAAEKAGQKLLKAFTVSDEPPQPLPLVLESSL